MIQPGLSNRLIHDITHRGISAWALSFLLFAFYLDLYFTEHLAVIAQAIGLDGKWTLYGLLYSLAIVTGGIFVLRKYRHDHYQVIRTIVVMVVQVTFGFSIPQLLKFFHQPEFYFSYFWPLKIDYLNPSYLFSLPLPYILYTFFATLLAVPILGAFFGKRWYCSWVCGCGGLANTAGDPFRQLSDKSSAAWKFERIAIYSVFAISILLTCLMFISWGTKGQYPDLVGITNQFQSAYGLWVGAILSGAIGVGLYPLGGTRVWCRNFCPMAALLGLTQKFGRFRIAVKENMCISCGLCSHNCEMGIDVRSYAQSNTSFVRASCVGCGICAEVCPRGVLRLENVTQRDPQERALVQIQAAQS